jgi:hypothetical protein
LCVLYAHVAFVFLRHQLAWDWGLVIVRGATFHHLVCDQKGHLMMSPCNRPLHHTEFTSRTERGCPGRLLPSRTVLCFRHQLAWDWALVIVRGATFHHLVCDQLGHMMMSPCNQSLHHTEFTSRTERGCPGRPLPSRTVLWFRHQLAWDWALIIMRGGTFHHLVCDQKGHLMMPPCNQSLHHTEFTSRTEREYPDRPLPSRTTSSPRAPGRVSLAHPRTLILLRQWPPPDTTPDAAWLLSPPLLPSRTVLCREAKRPRTPGRVSLTRTTSLTQTRTLGPSRGLAMRNTLLGSE